MAEEVGASPSSSAKVYTRPSMLNCHVLVLTNFHYVAGGVQLPQLRSMVGGDPMIVGFYLEACRVPWLEGDTLYIYTGGGREDQDFTFNGEIHFTRCPDGA